MQRGCQGEDCGGCGGQKCPDRRRRSCVFLGRLETSESINANRQERNTTTKSPARPSACFKSRAPSKNLLPTSRPQLLVRGGATFEARKTEWAHAKHRVGARWKEGGRTSCGGDLPPSSRRSHASRTPNKIAEALGRAQSAQTTVAGRATLRSPPSPAMGATPSSVPQQLIRLREPALERWRPSCTGHFSQSNDS